MPALSIKEHLTWVPLRKFTWTTWVTVLGDKTPYVTVLPQKKLAMHIFMKILQFYTTRHCIVDGFFVCVLCACAQCTYNLTKYDFYLPIVIMHSFICKFVSITSMVCVTGYVIDNKRTISRAMGAHFATATTKTSIKISSNEK